MGTRLVLVITDGRDDAGASRLLRLVEALDAWGHAEREGWQLADRRGWNRRGDDAEAHARAFRLARERAGVGMEEATSAGRLRALVEALEVGEVREDLQVTGRALGGPLGIQVCADRFRAMRFRSELERSVCLRSHGDLEVDLEAVGTREGMPGLIEAVAARFEPASMKVFPDAQDHLPSLATMAWYRDEESMVADLRLLADAEVAHVGRRHARGALLRFALELKGIDAEMAGGLEARLRGIDAAAIQRGVEGSGGMVKRTGTGLLVSRAEGARVAPFFCALLGLDAAAG